MAVVCASDDPMLLAQESVKLADAQLSAIKSGQEEAFLNILATEMSALENEYNILKDRINSNSILSPVDGKVLFNAFSDTIMQVFTTDFYVGYIPLKWKDQEYIEKGDSVFVKDSKGETIGGVITDNQTKVEIYHNEQIIMNICVFNNGLFSNPGIILPCSIETKKISILEYLQRKIL